ncbi:MAG: hypothetical protein HRT71_17545 [Flavobacteriales bacterium]|nr:hypothetical protein [Flavobacteriales bacterium]
MLSIKYSEKLVLFTICNLLIVLLLAIGGCNSTVDPNELNGTNDINVSKHTATLTNVNASKIVYTHQYNKDYIVLYPTANNLYYHEIERVVDSLNLDSIEIKFHLKNTYSNFKDYTFKLNGTIHSTSQEESFSFKFDKKAKYYIFDNLEIAVNTTYDKSDTYTINVSYDPKTIREESGRASTKSGFFVHETTVPFMRIPTDKFIYYQPTEEEKIIGRKVFGDSLQFIESEKEKIRQVAAVVIDAFESNRGIPSDTMDLLSPIDQYLRVKAGKDKAWCGNYAYIFTYACASFDIPARVIGLGNTYSDEADPIICHADHHTLTEVYNKQTQEWQIVDLKYYMLNATNSNGNSLNFIDFWYFLNIPQERENMFAAEYDPKKKEINELPVMQAENYKHLIDYYKQNQKFCYPYRKGNSHGYFIYK